MENTKALRDMLIKFYNMQAGTRFWTTKEDTQKLVEEAIDRCNGDVSAVKKHIRQFVQDNTNLNNERVFAECWLSAKVEAPVQETPAEPAVAPATDNQVQYSMGLLEQAVVQLISQMNADKIEQSIMDSVQDRVREFIKSEYGTIERKVITVIDGKEYQPKGVVHEAFDDIVKNLANGIPVYLVGPAGSGKNVLCKQVAEAMGLKFYFTNAVTQEYKLTGFTDAMGNYQETQFYKAFKDGGLFMLDEIDASIPEVLTILNAALANGYFDFPAPIGYVEAHPDFRVVAAGNTAGHGADMQYVARNQLDGATLDRFAPIEVTYSPTIEENVTLGNTDLLNFCRDFRRAADKSGLQVIVSYRGMGNAAKMESVLGAKKAIKQFIVKMLEKDDIGIILNNMKVDNEYTKVLREIMAEAH